MSGYFYSKDSFDTHIFSYPKIKQHFVWQTTSVYSISLIWFHLSVCGLNIFSHLQSELDPPPVCESEP